MSISNFSWVLPGKLAGSDIPGSGNDMPAMLWNDIEFLSNNGIRMLISLERPDGPVKKICESLAIKWRLFSIPDFGAPDRDEPFARLVSACIRSFESGKPVCVHCRAGIGRTGMALACIVGKHFCLSSNEAMNYVREKRMAVETVGQRKFIEMFLDGKKPDR